MVVFTCPYCDFKMHHAQYLNGKGHCLKCNAIVADRPDHPLNPEWTAKMKRKFDKLNSDGKMNKNGYGTLDYEEMKVLLMMGNPNLNDEEMREVFAGADTNGNGVIEFTEFLWFLYGDEGAHGAVERKDDQVLGYHGRAEHKKRAGDYDVPMIGQGHRAAGESSTYKLNPSDACESDAGFCAANNGGPHHFKFGKCAYCQMGEGQHARSSAHTEIPGGGFGGCKKGGKCQFKFGKCHKCGKLESDKWA
jgi:hypothetical protein